MASLSVPCSKICASNRLGSVSASSTRKHHSISFPNVPDASKAQSAIWSLRATVDEVASNSAPAADGKVKTGSLNGKVEAVKSNAPDPAVLKGFMAQVSDLVKLVDSRDIVELELKQMDCEIVIRKKEALKQPVAAAAPATAPMFSMPPQMAMYPAQPTAPLAAPSSSPSASAAAPAAPAKAIPSPSHPPLKSPMAGTFYRSPGPGEPPFVKVGDKVQKGQVVCIIEAMKLMNEIEADQSGTVTEIPAEDGKPVSVDTPLLVIVP